MAVRHVATLFFVALLIAGQSHSLAREAEVSYGTPVDPATLQRYLTGNSDLTLVDARSTEEYDAFHIRGAINMPMEQVDARLGALPRDRDAPILVYCVVGARATTVADALSVRGYRNVTVLPGEQLAYYDDRVVFSCRPGSGEGADACWDAQLDSLAEVGEALWSNPDIGSNGNTCAQCHPNAVNTNPQSYPKFQKQLGREARLPEMINWCVRNALKGKNLEPGDPTTLALQAYIEKQARQQRTATPDRDGQ